MKLEALRSFLERRLSKPVELRLNDNRQNLLTVVRPRGKPLRVSAHRMFLDASGPVRESMVEFIAGPTPEARAAIRRFLCENRSKIRVTPAQVRKTTDGHSSKGTHFDLRRIANRINRTYFRNRLEFEIVWGRRPAIPPPTLRRIQLGTYNERLQLVRIHPILDCPLVPEYYVAYIVHHELSHAVVPPVVDEEGRVRHHTDEFRTVERTFKDYDRAVEWQAKRLDSLVTHYCTRPPRRSVRQLTLF